MDLFLYFDGACEPNPGGVATWGYVIWDADEHPFAAAGGLVETAAQTTNNLAEYTALGKGLTALLGSRPDGDLSLVVRGDSKLVVEQLVGNWRCNVPLLGRCRDRCRLLLNLLKCDWRAEWVPRDENREADARTVAAWEAATGKPFPYRPPKPPRT